ncbi:MAG: branched-chain amino acid ABC transporter permease [Deltaproteobacteria bacterium]|nr:branched-chain amino acid ABC transporter permease [Deltaproteobacteria bacterium]
MSGKCGLFYTSYRAEAGLFPSRFQKACMAAFMAVLLICPWFLGSYPVSVLNLICIAVIGAVSLNLLTGVCGQISLGHGAFIGVGAYASAWFAGQGLPFAISLPLGGAVAAVIGMFFGIPSLRLKGIYLAIATLAAQLILEYVFLHWEGVTGGPYGLSVDSPVIFGLTLDTDRSMYYLILFCTVLSVLAAANVMRTRPGRAFVAIRDHHLSAEIVGVNLFAVKLQAFGLSSFMAGIAGGLWGHYTMYITPEPFGIGLSVSYLAMIIIGGLGSVLGSVFGAVFITLLPEGLNMVAGSLAGLFPNVSTYFLAMKEGVFGLILVLFLVFEPEGLARRWRLLKSYWKLYPFAY